MDQLEEKFKKLAEKSHGVRLTEQEKTQLRSNLSYFMKLVQVRKNILPRHQPQMAFSHQRSQMQNILRNMTFLATLLITAVLGGGVSFGAEQALPGDFLYPVKVGFNEEVRSALAISPEAKAQWQAERANRRLDEAEKLASQGKLTAENRTQIEENFEKQSESFNKHVAELNTENNTSAAVNVTSNFETALTAHARILGRLANDKKEEASDVNDIITKLQARTKGISQARAKAEVVLGAASSSPEIQSAAEAKLETAGQKMTEVKSFIESRKALLGVDATAQASTRIQAAEQIFADGKTKFDAKAYGESFVLFQKAMSIAQKAKLLVQARNELKLNIGINGVRGELENSIGTTTDENDTEVENNNESSTTEMQSQNEINVESQGNINSDDEENDVKASDSVKVKIGL